MMSTKDVMDGILAVAIPTIRESVFRTKFLPLIFNDDPTAFDRAWLHQVVGNPHIEVNVVSDTDPNHIYFTVPPLREHIDKQIPKELPLLLNYIDQEANSSLQPSIFTETNTINVIPIGMQVPSENQTVWMNILKFYRLVKEQPVSEQNVTEPTNGVIVSDDFDD